MFPQFDPSKLDPKTMMELSQMIRELPPEQLTKLQSLMHNMAAGFDVRGEMEELEKSFPPGFREKMAALMYKIHGSVPAEPAGQSAVAKPEMPGSIREARLTILRAVAAGEMDPEAAERILFPEP